MATKPPTSYIYTSWCFKQHGEKSLPSKCRRDGATTPRQRPRAAHGGFHGFLGPFKRLKEAQNGWCISWKILVKWINIDGLFHGKSYENGWWLGVPLGNHHIDVLMLICREKMGTSDDFSDNWIVIIECNLCFFSQGTGMNLPNRKVRYLTSKYIKPQQEEFVPNSGNLPRTWT